MTPEKSNDGSVVAEHEYGPFGDLPKQQAYYSLPATKNDPLSFLAVFALLAFKSPCPPELN